MKFLRKIRNYSCYCGIEKEEYNSIKKNAYISNFEVWRVIQILMALAFGTAFGISFFDTIMVVNRIIYGVAFGYSVAATVCFFILKKDSIWAQFLIYLSISVLLLFGAFVASNSKNFPAVSFIAFLLITPIFMIDKPYFITIELVAASSIFNIWMYFVKPFDIWRVDLINTIAFTILAILIHIISSSLRIKEFVLIKKINEQKDIDDLTGLKNKSCLTREINAYIERNTEYKQGIFFVLDIDGFKEFNDKNGHDVGDEILSQLGAYLKSKFSGDEVVGRFGGDEFIIFIKDNADSRFATKIANELASEVGDVVKLPNKNEKLSISMGIALYRGVEKNYSEVFKKADVALYKTKADRRFKFNINE